MLLLLNLVTLLTIAISRCDGSTIFGFKNYTEYIVGSASTNVIICAPHGGYEKPGDIDDRTHGCYDANTDTCTWELGCGTPDEVNCRAVVLQDKYTQEIARLLQTNLASLTGETPHVVINHLYRSKMDANREIDEATFGDQDATQAWQDFHAFMGQARTAVDSNGPGVFFDIHGQTHPQNWIEFGYLISGDKLDNTLPSLSDTSVRSLGERNNVDLDEIIRGASSMGARLQDMGYRSVPSTGDPGPAGAAYFMGGYDLKEYGSRYGGQVDGIQIESPGTLRNADNCTAYTHDLAAAVKAFMDVYYTDTPAGGSSNSVFGENDYVEYMAGSSGSPLILSVPHGGNLFPESIATREHGCYDDNTDTCTWAHGCGVVDSDNCEVSDGQDYNTMILAHAIQDKFEELSGHRAHMIINHLSREKMDPNREEDNGAQGEAEAVQAWNEYHNFINTAKATVEEEHQHGLLVDIHGQSHSEGWVELGYLVSGSKLDGSLPSISTTSIRALCQRFIGTYSLDDIIRGPNSIGTKLHNAGYASVPSTSIQGPNGGNYYNGGYITETHGSEIAGNVDGMQLESPFYARVSANVTAYGNAVAVSLHEFIDFFYQPVDNQNVEFGSNDYTEYVEGAPNSRLILVVTHGGTLLPSTIADRKNGCYDSVNDVCIWEHNCGTTSSSHCKVYTGKDTNTNDMGRLIQYEFGNITGQRPHLILNLLAKKKLDPSQEDRGEGCLGEAEAEQAYDDFHGFIQTARAKVEAQGGGLLLDIHGQSHPEEMIEVSYLYTGSKLDSGDTLDITKTSIKAVATRVAGTTDLEELIRGSTSLGGRLQTLGYNSVPSPTNEGPDGSKYYSGQYITKNYGSKDAGNVDAIQIDHPYYLRSSSAGNMPAYSKLVAQAVADFMADYY